MTEADRLAAKLTPGRRAFANCIAEGIDAMTAYRRSFKCATASDATVKTAASRMRLVPVVAEYIAVLIAKTEKKKALSRERKRELLMTCAEDEKAKWGERTKAIEVDNVMTGENAPQQVQVFGLGELLQMVRKNSKPGP